MVSAVSNKYSTVFRKEEKRLFGLIFGAVKAIGGGIGALVRKG